MAGFSFGSVVTRPFREIAAEHSHLLEDIVQHQAHIDVVNERAVRNGIVHIPPVAVSTAVTLAKWQTPIRDQLGRGTCYAFAAIAALEAAYLRRYNVTLGLSEQYAFHINKASELFGDYPTNGLAYENNSSLVGFQGSSDLIDKMARFAVPTRQDCPYLSDAQMTALRAATPGVGSLSTQEEMDAFEFCEQHIPTAARLACRYQVKDYRALPPNPSVSDIQAVISAGHEVVADIPGHCFLIIGYDIVSRLFIIKNSWGGNAFTTYGFNEAILGGRYILDVHPPTAAPQKKAYWMGRWNMDHDGWRGSLVIRRWTDYRRGDGEPTKLGNYYRDGVRHDVNGTTYDDGQRLAFWVADTSNKVQPGQSSGQPFNAHVFSWDPVNAGGLTRWNGIDFGVTLRRAALAPRPAMKPFDESEWVGNWWMNHDGWRGQLDIWGTRPLRASYRAANGAVLRVSGSIDSAHPHILNLSIAFAADNPQAFRLASSTWEKGVFAGTTLFDNREFGVQGERQGQFAVYGAIRGKWVILGAFNGFLGQPLNDESGTPDGIGRYNHFNGGSIYWTSHTGAFEVHGAIRDKWASMGWETSLLKYPLTDETVAPDGRGRYNHFEGGSIYWTPETGAHVVYGAIRDKWASMGWERSHLGYPRSDEKDWPGAPGGRYNDFEHGVIVWDPQGGARIG